MSGKPSPEGVQVFRQAMARLAKSGERIDVLNNEISARERELKAQREEYNNARKTMFEQREKMDVASDGNFGHEGRFEWFMRELHKQLTEPPTRPLPVISEDIKQPWASGPAWHNANCTCADCRPQ